MPGRRQWRSSAGRADPAGYEADLGDALNNLGFWRSEAGNAEQALPAAEEAVTILRRWRRLTRSRLGGLRPVAANPERSPFDADRDDDALAVSEEAVGVWRRLAEADPPAHEADYAQSPSTWRWTSRQLAARTRPWSLPGRRWRSGGGWPQPTRPHMNRFWPTGWPG